MTDTVSLLCGEPQRSESYRAIQACNDYLRMGPSRSLSALAEQYAASIQNAPTGRLLTLKGWSRRYGWVVRAESYDARLEAEKNTRAAEVMASGLALAHERVDKLKELAAFLEGQMYERGQDGKFHNVWLPDTKAIGQGEHTQIIDIEHFNGALISQYRETLADIAAETGGRVKKSEVTGADGGPLVIELGGVEEDDF